MQSLRVSCAPVAPHFFSPKEESPHSQVHSKRRYLQCLAPPLLAAFISLSPLSYPPVSHAQPIDGQRGAALFNKACIGCHDGGGNILQPGATLFMKDLQRGLVRIAHQRANVRLGPGFKMKRSSY
ncbi:cytochrome c6, chloroplastic isoform X3 [Magnolia sinica]|uniref:cytochrome c6, chloroplastic isoform X3 n=1 Tax=Magnolia sinica TaxID=86752 RepID=UPI002658A7C6|nr:cytochrome c6, chloroplastic isoform X3 [Magnolia sinica]